jgi:hypothetical protein
VALALAFELRPVGALAEHAQPVAAQALGHIQIGMLAQKLADFAIRAVLKAHGQAPVIEPRLEQVTVELLGVSCELNRVAGAVGVVGPEQRLIG